MMSIAEEEAPMVRSVGLSALLLLALAAYATYVINAAQFLLKLRAARLEAAR